MERGAARRDAQTAHHDAGTKLADILVVVTGYRDIPQRLAWIQEKPPAVDPSADALEAQKD